MIKYNDWSFSEEQFNIKYIQKTETIMALGNGYIGTRSCSEENYLNQVRNTFINGTFNKFSNEEVTELPNIPDLLNIEIYLDTKRFHLECEILQYKKELFLNNGLLKRTIKVNFNNKIYSMTFSRFISLNNLHVLASKVEITCNEDFDLEIKSGINGTLTNTGSQHLNEISSRFYEKKYLQMNVQTTQSKIDIELNTTHKTKNEITRKMLIDRRQIYEILNTKILKNEKFELDKISYVQTSNDQRINAIDFLEKNNFNNLFKESDESWNLIWNKYNIEIKSKNNFDMLALRFAIYHLTIMTPTHNSNLGIGAKGLTGEGYKGHSFWDTEIFILPFFMYHNPKIARSLLKYRYKGLKGAHKKALENGFKGAMFPWETANPEDGEVTPINGAVDVITGLQTKIWTGFIEQHITADIALAVWQYYTISKDQDFMDKYGYEIIFDTAIFWASRCEYNENLDRYEINNVIGPDEYKEHVNNNAFTNYLTYKNIKFAIKYFYEIKDQKIFEDLNKRLNLNNEIKILENVLSKLYLPSPNENNIIPQDDTYLQKEIIDLEKYKNAKKVGTFFDDYSLDQANEIQVSKQADIMILFYLLEDEFSFQTKIDNYNYYEPKTLHDSSLSYSTHCILANDLNHYQTAYDLFLKAANIDLGQSMISSDHGIHGASLGGLWQCVFMGFAGIRMLNEKIRINPKLPENWDLIKFDFCYQSNLIKIEINKYDIILDVDFEFEFSVFGKEYIVFKKTIIRYNND